MDAKTECVKSFNSHLRDFAAAIGVVFPECAITQNMIGKLHLMRDEEPYAIEQFVVSLKKSNSFNKKGAALVDSMCQVPMIKNLGFQKKWQDSNSQQKSAIVEFVELLTTTAQSYEMIRAVPSPSMDKISNMAARLASPEGTGQIDISQIMKEVQTNFSDEELEDIAKSMIGGGIFGGGGGGGGGGMPDLSAIMGMLGGGSGTGTGTGFEIEDDV